MMDHRTDARSAEFELPFRVLAWRRGSGMLMFERET